MRSKRDAQVHGEPSYESLLSRVNKKIKRTSKKAIQQSTIASILEPTEENTRFPPVPMDVNLFRNNLDPEPDSEIPDLRLCCGIAQSPLVEDMFPCIECRVLRKRVDELEKKESEYLSKITRLESHIDEKIENKDLRQQVESLTKTSYADKKDAERSNFQRRFKHMFKNIFIGKMFLNTPYPTRNQLEVHFNTFLQLLRDLRISQPGQLASEDCVSTIIQHLNMESMELNMPESDKNVKNANDKKLKNANDLIFEITEFYKSDQDFRIPNLIGFWLSATHYVGKVRLSIVNVILQKTFCTLHIPAIAETKRKVLELKVDTKNSFQINSEMKMSSFWVLSRKNKLAAAIELALLGYTNECKKKYVDSRKIVLTYNSIELFTNFIVFALLKKTEEKGTAHCKEFLIFSDTYSSLGETVFEARDDAIGITQISLTEFPDETREFMKAACRILKVSRYSHIKLKFLYCFFK